MIIPYSTPLVRFDGRCACFSISFIDLGQCFDRKRKPMAAYRFGGLEGTLFRPGESGLMSMIG